ncbi:Hpt domain-containing protein [Pseudomonas sp. TMB3-21]
MADRHLDHNVLTALQEVMEDDYPILLDIFLSDSEERLNVLRNADTAESVGATAHSFKGSSSNMGAIHLAELCSALEQRVHHVPLEVIKTLIVEINNEFDIIRPLYEAELKRSRAEPGDPQRPH